MPIYTDKFEQSFLAVVGHEGGFTDDPKDRGNWTTGKIGKGELRGTKYGISALSYPHLDIKNLTLSQAKQIYKRDYWDRPNIPLLPPHLQTTVFDQCVNHGIRGGVRILQKAIGVKTDGIIGNNTSKKAFNITETRLLLFRLEYYINIVINRPSLLRYLGGWKNRVFALLDDGL